MIPFARRSFALLLAFPAVACGSPDPKAVLEMSDVETYWAVDKAAGERVYIAPVVRFTVRNKGAEELRTVQASANFRRKGEEELEWIHREFGRGGVLRRRMDGSRPFRMPGMAITVRGRSWAIRDEILGRRWIAAQMFKFVGKNFSTCTFPRAPW